MFKSHYNIATEGIRAGHKWLAKLGFGFQVEIIVTPVSREGGGGGGLLIPDLRDYRITIRITNKGKVWEQSYITDQTGLSSLEYVIATFKGIKRVLDNVKFVISSPIISIKKVWVNIMSKRQ